MKKFILACPPADKKDQGKFGWKEVIPPPGAIKARCARCGIKVWLGPKQQTQLSEATIQCFDCCRGAKNIISLGGQGSDYQPFD